MSTLTNMLTVIAAVVVASLVAITLKAELTASTPSPQQQEHKPNDAAGVAIARQRVAVVQARSIASEPEQVFRGTAGPLMEARLYPRATGYIKTRLVDVGDRVHKGQLLAVIDAPDLDDQLASARANLGLAKAQWEKAKAEAELSGCIEDHGRIFHSAGRATGMEYEIKLKTYGVDKAAVRVREAAIKVHEAAVQRLTGLQEFEKIVAPFPGVITARHIDPGDLVSADSTTQELFHLMRTDTLRVFVDVPEVFATGIQARQRAIVYRREAPLKPFSGKVTRTADALEPKTHTLRTEVQVTNPDNALRPGMSLQVKFVFSNKQRSILIPSSAVVTHAGAPRVAVLDDHNRVQYRAVQLGREHGAEVEAIAGLSAGDTIVVHPGDDIPEGTAVDPVHQQPVAR
jgi:RND family efflux transporter MFP subunit